MSALEHARRWASAVGQTLRRAVPRQPTPAPDEPPRHRRYLSDKPERMEAYLRAAREYVTRLSEENRARLPRTPFAARAAGGPRSCWPWGTTWTRSSPAPT